MSDAAETAPPPLCRARCAWEIRAARRAFGMRQDDLAARGGVSQSLIARAENAEKDIAEDAIAALLDLLRGMGAPVTHWRSADPFEMPLFEPFLPAEAVDALGPLPPSPKAFFASLAARGLDVVVGGLSVRDGSSCRFNSQIGFRTLTARGRAAVGRATKTGAAFFDHVSYVPRATWRTFADEIEAQGALVGIDARLARFSQTWAKNRRAPGEEAQLVTIPAGGVGEWGWWLPGRPAEDDLPEPAETLQRPPPVRGAFVLPGSSRFGRPFGFGERML